MIEHIARGLAVRPDPSGSAERDRQVLICWSIKGDYGYLPGGHIEEGESARSALAREFQEEAQLHTRVGPPLLIGEERFEQRGISKHEYTVVFHVELDSGDAEVVSAEEHIAFRWMSSADLAGATILPPRVGPWLQSVLEDPHRLVDHPPTLWFDPA